MKKRIKFLAFLFWASTQFSSAQTDYSVPITFSLTQTGINRFIASQWNETTFTKNWSGSYQGLNYSITLNRPVISLAENSIKIILSLNINATDGSNTIFNGPVSVSPTITIPSTTISASHIIGQYVDLRNAINNVAQLTDGRIKDVIEQALAPIDWIIYKGKALDASTTRIVETADIRLKGIPPVIFSVSEGQLNLTLQNTIQAFPPSYIFQWNRPSVKEFGLKISSNNKFSIEAIKIYNGNDEYLLQPYSAVESIYDGSLGQYVASATYTVSDSPNNLTLLSYRVKLRRQGAETSWRPLMGPVVGFLTGWYSPGGGIETIYSE